MTTKPPDRIGLCPNRVGEAKYVVAGVFIHNGDDKELVCEHCGSLLIIYEQVRTSTTANDG